jgi:hypothetical protein
VNRWKVAMGVAAALCWVAVLALAVAFIWNADGRFLATAVIVALAGFVTLGLAVGPWKAEPAPGPVAPGELCYVQHGSSRPGTGGQRWAIPHRHPEVRPAGSTMGPPPPGPAGVSRPRRRD